MKPRSNKQRRTGYAAISKAAYLHDELAEFEIFREFLPNLKKALTDGKTPEELINKYKGYLTARLINDALTDPDRKNAGANGRYLLDRAEGKAAEKKHVEHRFGRLKDQELDALLVTQVKDLKKIGSGDSPDEE